MFTVKYFKNVENHLADTDLFIHHVLQVDAEKGVKILCLVFRTMPGKKEFANVKLFADVEFKCF